jgi:hypothetical protein
VNEYKLTVFHKNGEKVLDDTFQAVDDIEAKVKGRQILVEKGLIDYTHRCTSPAGKLLLFRS